MGPFTPLGVVYDSLTKFVGWLFHECSSAVFGLQSTKSSRIRSCSHALSFFSAHWIFSRFLLAEAAGACATFNLFFVVKRYRFWLPHSFPTCPTAKAVMSFRVLKKLDSIRRTDSKSSNNNIVIRNVNINY